MGDRQGRRAESPSGSLSARSLLVLVALVIGLTLSFVPVRGDARSVLLRAEGLGRWGLALVGEGPLAMSPEALHKILFTPSGQRRPIVVIAPHMDDETLFCGETIAALRDQGFSVTVIFTTTSQGGRRMDPRFGEDRHAAYWQVASVLDVSRTFLPTIPDGAPLGGEAAKARLTEEYVKATHALTPDCVLFTVGGGGQYDHRVAELVGRRVARELQVPLFVYWGYGPHAKWRTASDKDWGPNMRPSDLAEMYAADGLAKKRLAIDIYRAMYFANGWQRYWVSIGLFEEHHTDQVGYVASP